LIVFNHPVIAIKKIFKKNLDFSRIDMRKIEKNVGNIGVIIEAGAADGVETGMFLDIFPTCEIFALEPVKQQFNFLTSKFSSQPRVKLFNKAFSSENGSAYLNVGISDGMLGGMGSSSLLKPKLHERYFPEIRFYDDKSRVETITFSKFLAEIGNPVVDLLWLDIQGKELEVLENSSETICKYVKSIHLEISRFELYEGAPSPKQIMKFLKKIGFRKKIDRVGVIAGNALYINSKYL
jgi:FkbM family methyltransferase